MNSELTVVSVESIAERDIVMNLIYKQLIEMYTNEFMISKETRNKLVVYHNEDVDEHLRSRVHTYVVIVFTIDLDFARLAGWCGGKVTYRLDKTIDKVTKILNTLHTFQGTKQVKENTNVETLDGLVRSLS